ncbi:MAG TPA: hypothetical protein VGB61_12655, partial [Pyrinomonadaceae bacterium]
MNHHLTEKFFALALLLAFNLTGATPAPAQQQEQQRPVARLNSVDAGVEPASSARVQSSDVPLMGTLAVAASTSRQTPQATATAARAEQSSAQPQATP